MTLPASTEASPLLSYPSKPSITSEEDSCDHVCSRSSILDQLSFSLRPQVREDSTSVLSRPFGKENDDVRLDSAGLLERLSFASSPRHPSIEPVEPFSILMEVIGGRNLRVPAETKLQPYCVVHYGSRVLHRTLPYSGPFQETSSRAKRLGQALKKTIGGSVLSGESSEGPTLLQLQNPIWTIQHDGLWSVEVVDPHGDIKDQSTKRVTLAVWGRPMTTKTRGVVQPVQIGKIKLTLKKLLALCTEERVEMPLVDDLGKQVTQTPSWTDEATKKEPSLLAFRCRIASPADLELVQEWNARACGAARPRTISDDTLRRAEIFEVKNVYLRQQPTLLTEQPEEEVDGAFLTTAYMTGKMKGRQDGKLLVKPYADPKRVWSPRSFTKSNMYMTKDKFHEEIPKPSTRWIQAGTPNNTNARIYLEILSCHNLPNVDYGESVGNKTDAFCAAIVGDSMLQTDMIDDETSPHWPPWSQRAFVFNLTDETMNNHMLYLATFGYKRRPIRRHTPIGRVEINWLHLPRNSLLELEYNLYKDSHSSTRQAQGTIRIRLRIDVPNERAALLSSLKALPCHRPPIYINVRTKKSWAVAKFTACGEANNSEKFQLGVLQGYIDEILQQFVRRSAYNLHDGGRSLIFWRPHNQFQLQIGRDAVFVFPLYSLLCFVMGLLVVEHPNCFPGMLFLGLGLFLLVQMDQRNRSPCPWRRCSSFWHYLQILVIGKVARQGTSIGHETIQADEGWDEIVAQEKAIEGRIERNQRFFQKKEAVEKELEKLENVQHLETKSKDVIHLELLIVLGKVQAIVGNVCRFLRLVDSVVTWEESDLAFFLTIALLLTGLLIVFLPWVFLLKWTGRIVVVVLLGPQNRLIDVLYVQKQSDDEHKLRRLFRERMFQARCKQEESTKLGSFRSVVFGKYSIAVPSMLWTPHKDFPLPASTAHFEGPEMNDIPPRSKALSTAMGQMLFGNIIPRPRTAMRENNDFSTQQKDVIESCLETLESYVHVRKSTSPPSDRRGTVKRELSINRDAGFEVTDLFDEEAQYVRDVFREPPPLGQEESLRELGVEVLTNTTQSRRFLPAWKSIHEFPSNEEDDNKSSSSSDDSVGEKKTATEPSAGRHDRPKRLAEEKNKKRLHAHELSTVELGVEVASEFENEAAFAQQSWRASSSSCSPPEAVASQRLSLLGLEITNEYKDEAAFARQSWRVSSKELPPHHHETQEEAYSRQEPEKSAANNGIQAPEQHCLGLKDFKKGVAEERLPQASNFQLPRHTSESEEPEDSIGSQCPLQNGSDPKSCSTELAEVDGFSGLTLLSTVPCIPECPDPKHYGPGELQLQKAASFVCCMDYETQPAPQKSPSRETCTELSEESPPRKHFAATRENDKVERSVRFTLSEPLPVNLDEMEGTATRPVGASFEYQSLSLDQSFSIQEGEPNLPDSSCGEMGFEVVPDWM